MTDADVKVRCPRCLGTGQEESGSPPTPRPCTGCGGTGYTRKDKIDTTEIIAEEEATNANVDEVESKVDKLLEICEKILEIVGK